MDPLAHTLVGASLAETGLRRKSSLATATLILGANAPDVDALAAFAGGDAQLLFRRGWTHGVLAWVVLPVVVMGVMLAWDRFVRRRRHPDREPARAGPLLLLSAISVWSHPALDWLNTYGVRLLMPFDGRWFYGDALFIIDPWMWLLTAAAVVLARSRSRPSLAAWIVLGTATTALVTVVDMVPWGAKVAWVVGLSAIVVARTSARSVTWAPRVATVCLAVLAVYIGTMIAGSRLARAQAGEWLREQGVEATVLMAGPEPANPFVRDVIAVSEGEYRFIRVDWLGAPRFSYSHETIERPGDPGPVVEAALAAPSVEGMVNWMRFPAYEVQPDGDGYLVILRDVRYSRFRDAGIGYAEVRLDADLQPLEPSGELR